MGIDFNFSLIRGVWFVSKLTFLLQPYLGIPTTWLDAKETQTMATMPGTTLDFPSVSAKRASEIIGADRGLRRVLDAVCMVAPADEAVIIHGETGVGKEVIAWAIHEQSRRSRAPYIKVNCAAIPAGLLKSELFGHERGAFTGADRRHQGCFELASGGTLLLDEITEMKIELQPKLLRVLEEQKLRRVGGSAEVPIDVRVLAASNRDLSSAIREGRLREDLYYRLNVFAIEIAPLRERIDDLPLLVEHFIRQLGAASGKQVRGVDNDCLEALKRYSWPGNVRQVRNIIERALIVSQGPLLTVNDLPADFKSIGGENSVFQVRVGSSLSEVEKELLRRTIEYAGGNKTKAAEILGISLKTLYNRMHSYDGEQESGTD
jgi:transcriptional regulator with PAS, ATPase and Fis domain